MSAHAALCARVTRKLRELEGRPDARRVEEFLERCAKDEVDLSPWAKRVEALRRAALVREIMES